jgi:hypothetical protein
VVLLVTVFATVVLSTLVGVVWRRQRRRKLTEREKLLSAARDPCAASHRRGGVDRRGGQSPATTAVCPA